MLGIAAPAPWPLPRAAVDRLDATQAGGGREIEGSNISNVFKRTFYQIVFKFQVTRQETSVGCLLALPRPVWDSWHAFLGSPSLQQQHDGTWRLLNDLSPEPSNWIYAFDIDEHPAEDGGPAPIRAWRVIGTDAATLTRAALEIAPAKAIERGEAGDRLLVSVATRMRRYLPT